MLVPLWDWFQKPDHELLIILIASAFIIGFLLGYLRNRNIGPEKKFKTDTAFFIYEFAGRQSPKKITTDLVYVRLHGPNPYQPGSSLSHWSTV